MQIWGYYFILKFSKINKSCKYSNNVCFLHDLDPSVAVLHEVGVDGVLEDVVEDDLDHGVDPLMSMDRSENKTYFC